MRSARSLHITVAATFHLMGRSALKFDVGESLQTNADLSLKRL